MLCVHLVQLKYSTFFTRQMQVDTTVLLVVKCTSLAIDRPSSIHVGLERLLSVSSTQITLYAIGCMSSLPCRHCVKPANSARGKASLVIGSRKKLERRPWTLKKTLLQGKLKSQAEWAGLPSQALLLSIWMVRHYDDQL